MEQKILKYQIATTRDLDDLYTYSSDIELNVGQLVIIEFRRSETIGVVVSIGSDYDGEIKSISALLPYQMLETYVEFAKFVSKYTLIKLGSVFKLFLPFSIDLVLRPEKDIRPIKSTKDDAIILSESQKDVADEFQNFISSYKTILLHGITGSGKTAVFIECAKLAMRDHNSQILILVPEVALSSELAKIAASKLNADVFIWHNSITPARKLAIWKKAINGDPIVIVGARSALFIPFSNLRCIVIDEEHDGSFKQNEGSIYNARDMAVCLASKLDIPIILSSATPSIESYNNAMSGKYIYQNLDSRFHKNASLPKTIIYDLRKEKNIKGILSSLAISEINECLNKGLQSLIFVNRRGHTPKILCKSCGWKVECPGCSAWLCYHRNTNEFVCHYCGFRTKAKNECHECGKQDLIGIGSGIEKAEQECKELFPNARILTLSSDTINTPQKISRAIEAIKNNEVDIILGTQIVSKGHNFNSLSLVIITCIDAMLYGDDFRSLEKTFQLVHQVSGRAGRIGNIHGKVIIQTYNPDDKIMHIISNNNISDVYEIEMINRKRLGMPPFAKIASITLSSFNEQFLLKFSNKLAADLPKIKGLKILGPIQPAIYKIKSRYRQRIILLTQSVSLQKYIKSTLGKFKVPKDIKLTIDIDPYDFM